MLNEIKSFDERKKELVKIGKEKGYITYEELAASLTGLDLDADSLDELYNLFNENNIAVVSEEETEGNSDNGDKLLLDDSTLTKDLTINDPVRMYLKQMGQVPLLSRDQEVNISKRVEKAEYAAQEGSLEERLQHKLEQDQPLCRRLGFGRPELALLVEIVIDKVEEEFDDDEFDDE